MYELIGVKKFLLVLFFISFLINCSDIHSDKEENIIIVPYDYRTIQEAINAANLEKFNIKIDEGIYYENLVIEGKKIILSPLSGNVIVDGNGKTIIDINDSEGTQIIGLKLQNGDDGISSDSLIEIRDSIIVNCIDGIDYEDGSGGVCINNVIEKNLDDGIDLDDAVDVKIENCHILNNHDDGIEIRFQPCQAPMLYILIKNNKIQNHGEDGIQLIGYGEEYESNRTVIICYNLILDTKIAAIGFMCNGNTFENCEGANISARVLIYNNTFDNNNYGVLGGGNTFFINNIILNTKEYAIKNMYKNSKIAYNIFWNNKIDILNSMIDGGTLLFLDPKLNSDYTLNEISPCINKGISSYFFNGELILQISPELYKGLNPDLGAFESSF